MDTTEHVHVVDVKTQEELEVGVVGWHVVACHDVGVAQVVDISSVELIYSSSFFKSLATGGNVSKALVMSFSGCLPGACLLPS